MHCPIIYLSPNGATAKVATTLADQLLAGGATVDLRDLSLAAGRPAVAPQPALDGQSCLLVGSPVYRDGAVPPVLAYLRALPPTRGAWAVPFVTYGLACSGVALWQMAKELRAKGFRIAGAAKVAALHSLMWQEDQPVGAGHPDAEDLRQVRQLAAGLLRAFAGGEPGPLPLEALDYQPAERAAGFKAKLERPWAAMAKTLDEPACLACGACAAHCPAAAISLEPKPVFHETCIDCFACIRGCPRQAIRPAVPLAQTATMIRHRLATIHEQPLTQIFPAQEPSRVGERLGAARAGQASFWTRTQETK